MNRKINPEMIVLARDAKGMTQADLAKAVCMTQATISRYEAGLVDVPIEHLSVIAKILERPESFFFWDEKLYGASCLYHRKQTRISVGELKTIHARVNILRMQTARLLKSAEVQSDYMFHRLDQQKHGGPAGCARELRRLWQLPTGPIRNVISSIESAGGIVFRCRFESSKVIGISQWPLDAPTMPPVFFVNEDFPGDRQRWTLCHEIGHVVMHHLPSDNPEKEADEFASEFLMPASEIGADLININLQKATMLKAFWRASIQAIICRASQLEKITPQRFQNLYRQLSAKGYRKCEPLPLPAEEPSMFKDILEVHMRTSHEGIKGTSEFLGEPETVFRSDYWRSLTGIRLVG